MTTPRHRIDFDVSPMGPSEEGSAYSFGVHVPGDLVYLQGHFDDMAVLPAVVQLHTLGCGLAAETWPGLPGSVVRLTQLKFRRLIRPGESLVLKLRRPTEAPLVAYVLTSGERVCSQGTLEFNDFP